MADKKLEFALSGKGWQDLNKQLGIATKSLENLKKAGFDVGKVFKGISVDSGVMKFNKDLNAISKSMRGLSTEASTFLKIWTDSRVKASQSQFKDRLTQINTGIERYVSLLRNTNLETDRRIKLENNLVSLMAKKSVLEAGSTGGGGMLGSLAAKYLPTSPMGMVSTGLAMAGGGEILTRRIAGMVSDYITQVAQAKSERATLLTPRIMEAYQGRSQRQAYMFGAGAYDEATAYANQKLTPELIRQGYWGTAAGAQTPMEAGVKGTIRGAGRGAAWATGGLLAAGVAAGALFPPAIPFLAAGAPYAIGAGMLAGGATGLKEFATNPRALRDTTYKQIAQEGLGQWLERNGVKMGQFDYYAERADQFAEMQRLLGTGIYGRQETGLGGVTGRTMAGGYDRSQVERAQLNMAQRGGARAVTGGALGRALWLQRGFGIERADEYASSLSRLGGGAGGSATAVELSVARGVQKGLAGSEMKLEREAYTEAVMSASERMISRYGTFNGVGATTNAIAAATSSMLLPGGTLADVAAARSGTEAMAGNVSGRGSSLTRTMVMGQALRVFGGGKMGYGIPGATAAQLLADMPVFMRNRENPMWTAMAELNAGLSPDASQKAREAAYSQFELTTQRFNKSAANSLTVLSGPKGRKSLNDIVDAIKMSQNQPGGAERARTLLSELAIMTGATATPGESLEATGLGIYGTMMLGRGAEPGEINADFLKKAILPQDTGKIQGERARAAGELNIMGDVESRMPQIKKAFDVAIHASDNFTAALTKVGGLDGTIQSLSAGFEALATAMGHANIKLHGLLGKPPSNLDTGPRAPGSISIPSGQKSGAK